MTEPEHVTPDQLGALLDTLTQGLEIHQAITANAAKYARHAIEQGFPEDMAWAAAHAWHVGQIRSAAEHSYQTALTNGARERRAVDMAADDVRRAEQTEAGWGAWSRFVGSLGHPTKDNHDG